MNAATSVALCDLNTRFYAEYAESFSSTRSAGWAGWEMLLDALRDLGLPQGSEATVLDVACGNLRFERFLQAAMPNVRFEFQCVDNCEALAQEGMDDALAASVRFRQGDVVADLLRGVDPPYAGLRADFAVSWGFMHHIPTQAARIRFVRELLGAVRAGGCAAVSCWRFADEPDRRERAIATTQAGCDELRIERDRLDEGDYLLGWQNEPSAYRYCHSFNDGETRQIAEAVSDLATLVATFRADGKSNALNEYLVFQVHGA